MGYKGERERKRRRRRCDREEEGKEDWEARGLGGCGSGQCLQRRDSERRCQNVQALPRRSFFLFSRNFGCVAPQLMQMQVYLPHCFRCPWRTRMEEEEVEEDKESALFGRISDSGGEGSSCRGEERAQCLFRDGRCCREK